MVEPSLGDKVVALHAALDRAKVPHAFGGALALAYYGEPRATIDVDINVFVAPEQHEAVIDALAPLGVRSGPPARAVIRDGQGRWRWGNNPVDLFFSSTPFHDAMRARVRTVPFGDDHIPILCAEHLVAAKVIFDRAKDWIDIEQVLLSTTGLDHVEIDRWLNEIIGADDHRATRLRNVQSRLLG